MISICWTVMDAQHALDAMPIFLSGIGDDDSGSSVYQELAPAWAELESDLQGFGSGAVHLQHKSQRLKLILLVKLADLVTEGGTELVLFSQEDDEQGVTLDAKKITSMFMVPNPSPGSDDELYLEALEALGVIAKRLNLQAIFADTDVPTGVWF